MSNKVELKLNKSSIFRIARFIADLQINENLVNDLESLLDSEGSELEFALVGGQTIARLLAESENETDELLADLADVDVSVIQDLSIDEYFDLVESFTEAGLFKRALSLTKMFQN